MNFRGPAPVIRKIPHRPRTAFNDPLHGYTFNVQRKTQDAQSLQIEEEDLLEKENLKKERAKKMTEEKDNLKKKYGKRRHFELPDHYRQTTLDSSKSSVIDKEVENLEETKRFNRLVVDIKCKAIREAQLKEKHDLRMREKEKESEYAKDLEDNLRIALKLEKDREVLRKEAKDLVAKNLSQQIEEHSKHRQENQTKKREEEFAMSQKWKERLREDREKEVKKEAEKKRKLKEEALKSKKEIQKRKEEERLKEKLEHRKILEEQVRRQEAEDNIKKKEADNKALKEQVKDFWVKEKEREIEESLFRKEVNMLKERESEERIWRAKMLQEAKEKKKKNEREVKEREIQIILKQEAKLREKMNEKEEEKRLKNHSIVTEEREKREEIKSAKCKSETKAFLRDQIAKRSANLAARSEQERREKEALKKKHEYEDAAFLAYKDKTVNDLKNNHLSQDLINDLERQFQKTQKNKYF